MFYKSVDKEITDILEEIKKHIDIIDIQEKKGDIPLAKIFIITAQYRDKPFKISLVSFKGKTTISVVFSKKLFSEDEIKYLKNIFSFLE